MLLKSSFHIILDFYLEMENDSICERYLSLNILNCIRFVRVNEKIVCAMLAEDITSLFDHDFISDWYKRKKYHGIHGFIRKVTRLQPLKYCIYCIEHSHSTNKLHIQAFLKFMKQVFGKLKRHIPDGHLEQCRGNEKQNIDYIRKDLQNIYSMRLTDMQERGLYLE